MNKIMVVRLKKTFCVAVLWAFCFSATAQVPSPAKPQSEPIALLGGTAHIGTGEVIDNSIITFREGKIEHVLDMTLSRMDLRAYRQIDVSGKHIYPGLILLMSDIGLIEINSIRASKDLSEVGNLKPHIRSAIAYNTDSEIIPTLRLNGIQLIQVVPQGGRISGTSSVMQLDAWNWEDALYKQDDAVHLNWPSLTRPPKAGSEERGRQPNEKYAEQVEELNQLFADAKVYPLQKKKEKNLVLEAMQGVLAGKQSLFVRVNRAQDIISAIQILKKLEVSKGSFGRGERCFDGARIGEKKRISSCFGQYPSIA